MAALEPVLVVSDLNPDGTAPGSSSTVPGVISAAITWALNVPESISYQATGPETSALTPGQAPSGTRVIGISLGNGDKMDTRMLSGGAEVVYDEPAHVDETGEGLARVLGTSRIGRLSVQQVTFSDVITAAQGKIQFQTGGTLRPSTLLPDVAGIGATPLNPSGKASALDFTFLVDPALANDPLDLDLNRDTRLRSLETVVERIGTISDPLRAQFVCDSGDFGVDGGTSQSVTIGHKGSGAYLHFDGTSAGNVPYMVQRQTHAQAQTKDMCRSCSFTGGASNHGMPDGGGITCIKTVNRLHANASGDYRFGMPIVGVYVDKDHGGVYCWPGDGALHAMSQAMGIRDLWYEERFHFIYAATDSGVYRTSDNFDVVHNNIPWERIGLMSLATSKLCLDGQVLYALVTFQDGSTHILQWLQAAGTVGGKGYDGWSVVASLAGISDFGVGGGFVYYIANSTGSQAVVWRVPVGGGTPVTMPIPGGGTVVATGIDVVTLNDLGSDVQGLFVRTSAGSKGLYYIDVLAAPGSLFDADPGGTLRDQYGAPVMVNKITGAFTATGLNIQWSDGVGTLVQVWASTNRGVFGSLLGAGVFHWRRTDGQDNSGDREVIGVASAPPAVYLKQLQTRVYAIAARSFYQSNDGTLHFVDMLAEPLTGGPAFYALFPGFYPTTADDTLSYGNYTIVRQHNGLGHDEYLAVNPASTAPAWAHRDAEITQIGATSLVPEIPASQLLLDGMCRFLGFTADPQVIVEVESAFTDTADLLRTLRPTMLVTLSADMKIDCYPGGAVTFASYSGESFYVLSHTIRVDANDAGIARTTTRLGKVLIDDRSDPLRVVGDLFYASSRQALYRQGAR